VPDFDSRFGGDRATDCNCKLPITRPQASELSKLFAGIAKDAYQVTNTTTYPGLSETRLGTELNRLGL